MRLIIDKDYPEIQLLQEAYEKQRTSYKVLAVENGEKFVYGQKLTFNEAKDTIFSLAVDENFNVSEVEICECTPVCEKTIWSSDSKTVVSESTLAREGFGDWLSGVWKSIKDSISKFNKGVVDWWRKNKYIDKENRLTGLGYKVMTKEVKPAQGDGGDEKAEQERQKNLEALWKTIQTNAKQAIDAKKQYEPVNLEQVKGIVKNDKDPVLLQVPVVTKPTDGGKPENMFLLLTQDGDATKGDGKGNPVKGDDGKPVSPDGSSGDGSSGDGSSGDQNDPNKKQISPEEAQKNPKAALGNLSQRVADLENYVYESKWNYNNEETFNAREGYERRTIKRFFNEMNDPSVKGIKFIRPDGTFKNYDISNGSQAYSEFKKDFRECTEKVEKSGDFHECRVVVESLGHKSALNGFKFSDFGMDDDFDSESRTIVIRESVIKETPDKPTSKKKVNDPRVVEESAIEGIQKNPEPNGFTVELDRKDPLEEVKALLASMNKYNGVEPKKPDNQDGSIDAGVSTYPDVPTFETPKKQEPLETPKQETPKVETPEVVKEADDDEGGGDDAGGGDADPFGGGDDAGGGGGDDAGGDADPFGGGGDEGGGDDAGGDAGGDADPFGGGGDDAGGGDMGGGDAGGGDAGADAGGDAAGAEEDPAAGEPAPSDAVNTDAEGNPKSQYNINVTKPFNSDDDFSLNEEEQKEFFGKIDQLVKIPDMDNYSLYLYQITPENMNLDDVHYIQALYDLSVKLGLLEDIYADSNLLEKYSSYKYSVLKDGESDATKGDDALTVQEQGNPIYGGKVLTEAEDKGKKKGISKVQDANGDNINWIEQNNEERLGPKEQKLDVDKNGAPKPVVIDTTKEGWDSLNGKEHGKLVDSTVEGDFHGLGWLVTFKAMQFGSPRYMTMYIKKNGNEKAEKQCEEYLKRLSYSEIEFVKISEIDPYEYMYRQSCSGMKTPEEIQQAACVNKDTPYLESKDSTTKVPESIPGDIQRDIKRVITKLNAEIRGTKQFNFLKECGEEKPQLDHLEFLTHYKTAQVNETLSETTYKFVLKKNDSMMSRMFFSNLKEKLFKYLATFATKYNMECGCEATPKAVTISFMRSDIGNPGYDLETMVDTTGAAPSLDEALALAAQN